MNRVLYAIAVFLGLAFFVAEIVIGERNNSIALVGDSYRFLTGVFSIGIGLVASKVSHEVTEKNTYGWVRVVLLGSFLNAVFLFALLFSVVVKSLKRLVTIEEISNPLVVLVTGLVGLGFNCLMLALFGSSTLHHLCSHNRTDGKAKEAALLEHEVDVDTAIDLKRNADPKRINICWIVVHIIGNFFGSITVVISSVLTLYGPGQWCHYADPVLSICMVAVVVTGIAPLFRACGSILLQTVPPHVNIKQLKKNIQNNVPNIKNIHELHVWQLTETTFVATLHFVSSAENYGVTVNNILKYLRSIGIDHVTMQPEFPGFGVVTTGIVESENECMLSCPGGKSCADKRCCVSEECVKDEDVRAESESKQLTYTSCSEEPFHNIEMEYYGDKGDGDEGDGDKGEGDKGEGDKGDCDKNGDISSTDPIDMDADDSSVLEEGRVTVLEPCCVRDLSVAEALSKLTQETDIL